MTTPPRDPRPRHAPPRPSRPSRQAALFVLTRLGIAALLVACGSRTGLFGEDDQGIIILPDGGIVRPGFDAGVRDVDVPEALPPIDAAPRDASRLDCPDADATLVYVVTESYDLYSYFPTDGSFTFISKIACPSDGTATPFSMAVNRTGIAYVAYNDGNLYRVSTATGACIPTGFVPGQQGFSTFGMGFATNAAGPTETLYVASSSGVEGLGRVDTNSFALTTIGPFVPTIQQAELTGTGDGRLFAFYNKNFGNGQMGNNGPPSYIGEIDTASARVVAETPFPTVGQGSGWAFGFWGGDFYMFTSADGVSSDVTRYRPSDNSVNNVGSLPSVIVGAGVSTCAPSQ